MLAPTAVIDGDGRLVIRATEPTMVLYSEAIQRPWALTWMKGGDNALLI